MQAGTFSKSSYSATRHCLEAGVFRKSSRSFQDGHCLEAGVFHKASYSTNNGSCLEAGVFRRSSYSYHEALCAEVGVFGTVVRVRDTKQSYLGEGPERPVLEFSVRAWERLLADIKSW